jgi:hypothetical protein
MVYGPWYQCQCRKPSSHSRARQRHRQRPPLSPSLRCGAGRCFGPRRCSSPRIAARCGRGRGWTRMAHSPFKLRRARAPGDASTLAGASRRAGPARTRCGRNWGPCPSRRAQLEALPLSRGSTPHRLRARARFQVQTRGRKARENEAELRRGSSKETRMQRRVAAARRPKRLAPAARPHVRSTDDSDEWLRVTGPGGARALPGELEGHSG